MATLLEKDFVRTQLGEFGLDPNLVLSVPLWKRDGTSIMSDDAYGHLCTVTGATWTLLGRLFDGLDDKIVIQDSDTLRPVRFTIASWIKTTAVASAKIFANYDRTVADGEKGFHYYLRQIAGGNYTMVLQINNENGVPVAGLSGFTIVNDGNWHFVAVTYADLASTYYIDCVQQPAKGWYTSDVIYHATSYPTVGAFYSTQGGGYSSFYAGTIAMVLFYSGVVTSSQLAGIYYATKWRL